MSFGENGYIIIPVSSYKLHGIHVDNTLSWKTYITHLCSKLQSRLYLFHQVYLMPPVPLPTRKKVVCWSSTACMDYGCVRRWNCSRNLLVKVHKMIKMYERSILDIKDKRQSLCVTLFQTLCWHTTTYIQYQK